jgi:hypothetical protein
MEEIIYDSQTVTANYFQKDTLVHLWWKKEANTNEYRQIFQALVDFVGKNKVRYIISDMRKEGLVSIEDVKWLEEEILKKAIVLGIEKIALINDETVFSTVYAETVKRKLINSPVKVQIFNDFSSAKVWLTSE